MENNDCAYLRKLSVSVFPSYESCPEHCECQKVYFLIDISKLIGRCMSFCFPYFPYFLIWNTFWLKNLGMLSTYFKIGMLATH